MQKECPLCLYKTIMEKYIEIQQMCINRDEYNINKNQSLFWRTKHATMLTRFTYINICFTYHWLITSERTDNRKRIWFVLTCIGLERIIRFNMLQFPLLEYYISWNLFPIYTATFLRLKSFMTHWSLRHQYL